MRSASTRHATSAASVSLSPKRICSTEMVSFSFTMGTTPSSSRRSNVSRACRYARRSAVSRRVSSTVDVTMPWRANASAYAVESALCPTEAAACRLGMSCGRFSMLKRSRPQAMAAEVTTMGRQPAARTRATWSVTSAR